MDFTKIRLKGFTDIDLPLVGTSPSDIYLLKAADGLGPPKVDVFMSKSKSGVNTYNRSQTQDRELVFQVGLNPDYSSGQTTSEVRDTLYGLLTGAVDDLVTVQIMDNTVVVASITGYVKNVDPVMFTKDPEVQIVIACVDEFFAATSESTSTYLAGIWTSSGAPKVTNLGTAPAFFNMKVTINSSISSWTLLNAAGDYMQFSYAFVSGDELYFNTAPGERTITVKHSGVTTTRFEILSADSSWLKLQRGTNVFSATVNYSVGEIKYTPKYWGV